ncbi:psmD10 [Symbiodinium pilosum]|uniref:PsmD10 protein n=1 Tax=Symbiodinium pilosum TaxID=2952 RepID=A0A812URF5_SYMPI|nr:psmD10 [Symbiodinium pilosum]
MADWDPDFPPAVNLLNNRGETGLHVAASADDLDLCKLLLTFQARINDAECFPHPFSVEDAAVLLKWRAEANAVDSEGATPLALAAVLGAPQMIQFLLKQGASPQVCRSLLPKVAHAPSRAILQKIL